MIQVGRDDLLRALKRLKGIAKQDILTSNLTPYPEFWKAHAEARRVEYANLIQLVEDADIEKACAFAFSTYSNFLALRRATRYLPKPKEGNRPSSSSSGWSGSMSISSVMPVRKIWSCRLSSRINRRFTMNITIHKM